MKKVIMILMAAATMTVMSCGDGNRSSESANDTDTGGDNTEVAEPADTTTMQSDTTTTGDMDQRQDDNDMDRGESGTTGRSATGSESRNQRDSIQ
jgi:hypothetical protein